MDNDIDLNRPVELIALAVKGSVVRCRILGSDRVITLRSGGLWDVAPGEIVTVAPASSGATQTTHTSPERSYPAGST